MLISTLLPSTLIYMQYSDNPSIHGYVEYMGCMYDPNYYIQNYYYNANATRWCI